MKYDAKVNKSLHKTIHGIGIIENGHPVMHTKLPDPDSVQIIENNDGVFLFYLNDKGEIIADTWHASVADAMKQAEFEFGISNIDWVIS